MEEEEKEKLIVSKVFTNLNLLMSTTHKSMGLSANASPMVSQYNAPGIGMSEALL
jgi:hypothetical protein